MRYPFDKSQYQQKSRQHDEKNDKLWSEDIDEVVVSDESQIGDNEPLGASPKAIPPLHYCCKLNVFEELAIDAHPHRQQEEVQHQNNRTNSNESLRRDWPRAGREKGLEIRLTGLAGVMGWAIVFAE